MEPMPPLDRAADVAALRVQVEAVLGRVADAINTAPDGYVIAASERTVFHLFADLRKTAYEAGIPMRTDAADAAFSPSDGSRDGQDAPR